MKLKHFLSLAYILFLIACKQPKKINSNAFSDEIIKAFNGDLAYETTAFVEKYWRVVGNTGFNEPQS